MKTYNTYIDSWKHGQKYFYTTAHRCQKQWYGPCPECGSRTTDYGGAIICISDYCRHSSNKAVVYGIHPEPKWWNSNINVQKDGDSWCAFYDGFINLQESEAAFGDSPKSAVEALEKLRGEK